MHTEKLVSVSLGAIIRTCRISKGLTCKDLGLKLGYSSASAGQIISKIERGVINVAESKLVKLLKVLDITHERLGLPPLIPLTVFWEASDVTLELLCLPKVAASIALGGAELSGLTQLVVRRVKDAELQVNSREALGDSEIPE